MLLALCWRRTLLGHLFMPLAMPPPMPQLLAHMPPPPSDGLFTPLEETKKFCHAHAKRHGYALRIQSNNLRSQGSILLACNQRGKHKSAGVGLRDRTSRAKGCKMTVTIAALDKNGPREHWQIRHGKETLHNHPPASSASVFPSYRRCQIVARDALDKIQLDFHVGVEPRKTVAALQNQGVDLVQKSDVYNQRRRLQMALLQTQTPTEYALQLMARNNNVFFSEYVTDSENRLTTLFIAYNDSVALYKKHPNVVLIDCTYKTTGTTWHFSTSAV